MFLTWCHWLMSLITGDRLERLTRPRCHGEEVGVRALCHGVAWQRTLGGAVDKFLAVDRVRKHQRWVGATHVLNFG